MHNSFTQPTPEQRLQALQNYGETSDRLVRERERQRITSVSRSTAWKLERAGQFPLRKSIGPKSCAWLLSDLLCWISIR
ncbi:AlpA family phage regulatory protein [Salmonella enterica]|uniref:Transcriptional regulator n=2 Tax=Salmonella enterica TaxID=28901 RepID=A0A639YUF3_SALER|nr:transcriptional regulator [Salmonella enterica subsp. enterica serovar Poona]EAO6252211.1 AlpA family phage regulatory protein [Salmonella enterica]EBS2908729.1 transcriptional regulator [Salmonella enterica subsp. enterica serovar Flottbek]EBV1873332.1 transcriptional regulator [Salmonella enterica subsp. enterica serovar Adelaide]ECC9076392.1 transcriptional regulator [Salmonella enterica subsp. enterica]ECT8498885.1 AlpA family phage regulatory protein [Salmonella enterica subsp. enteric